MREQEKLQRERDAKRLNVGKGGPTNLLNECLDDDEREAHNNVFRRDGDRINKDPINYVSLESYEIDKSELKIFLRYTRRDDEAIKDQFPDIDPFRKRNV